MIFKQLNPVVRVINTNSDDTKQIHIEGYARGLIRLMNLYRVYFYLYIYIYSHLNLFKGLRPESGNAGSSLIHAFLNSFNHSCVHSFIHSFNQSINQSIIQSINQLIKQ